MQLQSTNKSIWFTYGRFQPCTHAHTDMFNWIKEKSKENGSDFVVCISNSFDNIKNPFLWEERLSLMQSAMPLINFSKNKENRLDNIIKSLSDAGYEDFYMVVGNDRIKCFDWVDKYKTKLNVKTFRVVEYGSRTICDVSSTRARAAAIANDYALFRKTISYAFNEAQTEFMFRTIKERIHEI